ncbi:MAG: hypothetical protein JOZ99_03115 [Actinobacteria bacterium]|nr:hypothetical protein [Actinomycetota bacterium]
MFITNLVARSVRADLTVMADANTSVRRQLDIPPLARVPVRVADVAAVPSPGVVVESIGGPVVVEHELHNGANVATGPCARQAAGSWYLAAGTTVKGAQQWLSLFDPFADDAIVDVTFLTDAGPQAPQALQGLVVPRRTKIDVSVHDNVPRQGIVAAQVHARIGRVVAEQVMLFDGSNGQTGMSLALGAPSLALDWYAPAGIVVGGTDRMIVANPGDNAATVTVDVVLDGEAKLTPQPVAVPDHSVVSVDLMSRVPANLDFWVHLHSDQPVFAAQSVATANASATVPAGPFLSREWAFASARSSVPGTDVLVAANPTSHPVLLRVDAIVSGGTSPVVDDPAVSIPPGARALVDLTARNVPGAAGLLVTAGAPISVERVDSAPQTMSATLGIPSAS